MDCLKIFVLLTFIITFARSDTILSSDGDYVDCVDKKQQRAFDHPLLQNHQIQESPSEIPKSIIRKSKWKTEEAHVSIANCPEGTVPELKYQPMAQDKTDHSPVHEYATRNLQTQSKLYGTKASINVWEPEIEKESNELSISQFWVSSGDYLSKDLNTIEVGWQVYPNFYADNKPRLFIYWTSDAYNLTGCYNLRCPGFIQTSSSIVLGGAITPISSYEGRQFEIMVFVWKDQKSGNWWLSLGPNNTLIGYWPGGIFTTLTDHADAVAWGGEITNSRTLERHTTTQMGSGRFPVEGFGRASYFRNLEVVNTNNSLQSMQDYTIVVNNSTFYDISNRFSDEWGDYFFYGGPGFTRSQSSAVRLALCSSLFYLCISFLFVI